MSNSSGKKLKSVLQSSLLVVPLVAILLLTNLQIGTRPVSANDIGTTSVVTPDPATATLLAGELQPVNTSGDDQTHPHVDCNFVSYTNVDNGLPTVRYFNLSTNTDLPLPLPDLSEALLSDVSGSRIAYTHLLLEGNEVRHRINVFDASTNTTFVVPGETYRINSAIGGDLVAFESRDVGFGLTPSEIQVYNLATGTLTPITNDSTMMNRDPAVDATGNVVTFQKCDISNTNCDIYSAVQATPGAFAISQLTGSAAEETNADTNGTLVVYESLSGGDRNIAYQPIGGGAETQIVVPGDQRNPNIVGNLISFESLVSTGVFNVFDIFVYDTSTNRLYRPAIPAPGKLLNDLTFCAGQFRLVYGTPGPEGDLDIYAFTFQLPESTSDEIEDLIALVRSFELKDGTESSLISKLEIALDALDQGDTATACDSLVAFVNEVQAQSDKKIPTAQADHLINSANQIKQALGCQ